MKINSDPTWRVSNLTSQWRRLELPRWVLEANGAPSLEELWIPVDGGRWPQVLAGGKRRSWHMQVFCCPQAVYIPNSGVKTAQASTPVLPSIQPSWAAAGERILAIAGTGSSPGYPGWSPETPTGCCSVGKGEQISKTVEVWDTRPVFPPRNGNDRKQILNELRMCSKHQTQ